MGRGKGKKGKKESGDVPSVAGLSISEDTPTTSQPVEAPQKADESSGLTGGVKIKQKQNKPQASSEPPKTSETVSSEGPPEPKVEPIQKEEVKEDESEGLTGGGKRRPRKKRSLAAVEATTGKNSKDQPGSTISETGPVGGPIEQIPIQRGPQEGALQTQEQAAVKPGPPIGQAGGFPGHGQVQGLPGQGQSKAWARGQAPGTGRGQASGTGRGQAPGIGQVQVPGSGPGQVPGSGRGQAPGYPGAGQAPRYPGPGQAPGYPGSGQAPGYPAPGQAPGYPGPGQAPGYPAQSRPPSGQQSQIPPQPQQAQTRPKPESTTPSASREVMLTPSNKELTCRYKIPAKILGRSVRVNAIKVITNYLPMTFKNLKVYRYDVTFKPDKPKKMLPTAFKNFKDANYPKDFLAFDQVKNCYALQPLKNVALDGERYSFEVQIKDNNGKIMPFQLSLKSTGVIDLGRIKDYMDGMGSSLNTPSEEIQCVDVILRQGALESYVKCGRQFFKRPNNPVNLGGGLEMWTGLFQSAIFTSGAFINIDVAHKGFPIQQSMIAAITNSFRLDTSKPIGDQRSREVETFNNFIKGLRVVARLVGPSNDGQTREFICNGLVDPPSRLKFTCEKNGKKVTMTVADYFQKEKGYRIQYPYLNCMWVGPKEKCIYYPMELLEIAYGQALNRQLNEMQLANIVKEAATPPYHRKNKIDEVARAMNYSTNPFFKKFGLEISDKFLELDAKILMPPSLNVGDQRPLMPRRGVWQTNRLVKPQPLESWGFIAIDSNPQSSNFDGIRDLLLNTGRTMGMRVSEPRMTKFNVRMTELRNVLLSAVDDDIRFLFIIVSSWAKDTYHKVKQFAERDVGILTQCIKEQTATRRMNVQTMKNILLKVNSKLMGINQVIDVQTMPNCLKDGGVMIVGADVTHPSPDQTSIPSIAAVTASMDAKCFSYNIELSIQTPKKEMIVEFTEMMYDHLKLYRELNRALPRRIYVFRDGVSEGQFAEVLNSELEAIHKAYHVFNPNQKPEVLFLLVQKRHHTRFFTTGKCENVEPGTCVDTHIVHPKELDFYLVSHQAIKGTARPTRYHAICNDSKIPHDEVEQLTYYLCHLYSRCMRSVSYPTPTYYAHLACLRARSLTHGQVFDNNALEKKPQRLRVLDKMLRYSRMFFV